MKRGEPAARANAASRPFSWISLAHEPHWLFGAAWLILNVGQKTMNTDIHGFTLAEIKRLAPEIKEEERVNLLLGGVPHHIVSLTKKQTDIGVVYDAVLARCPNYPSPR